MKKKKRRHFRNCAFLFSSGDRNILTLASLGQDGPRGSNKEKPSAFSALFLHFHLLLKACYQRFWKCKKPVITDWLFSCSGDRTRTCDLRVMSPTSSQLLHPAMYLSLLYFNLCSGYSPGERLPKLRDSTPQCIFHCFISINARVIRPMSSSRNFGTPPRNVSFIALFQFMLGLFAR